MKSLIITLTAVLLLLFGRVSTASAGPADDVAQIAQQQAAAAAKDDVDAYVVPYADDAVVTAFWIPFRVEGKAAIKEQFALIFQKYPTRQSLIRQPLVRSYANDTVVVRNSYVVDHFTDKAGNTSDFYIRTSQTWVKTGTEWKIVDQHVSRMPIP